MSNTNTATDLLANVAWDDNLETLEEQRCVLFLGGNVYEALGFYYHNRIICSVIKTNSPNAN
ncbi:MAG: hypothetical protein IPN76_31455 [Saprospiraceae bacterium]|nr:hypothetical protein [Saprospiraceae bacterium]